MVLRHYDAKEADVYGSCAHGEQTSQSDLDLRFLCGDSITYGDLYCIKNELNTRLNTEVDILTCHPEKLCKGFYDQIKQDEVLLYEAKRASSRILNKSKYSRLFPRSESESDCILTEVETIPNELCVPAEEGFTFFEERMGW